jgi:deazaflavin-dependent oxidoreductase (nitroreductase family)
LPREIEIWFTSHDGHYYIIAEYETSNWVQNIRANSAVKVRVAGEELAAHARILSGETELELIRKVRSLSEKKYGWGDGLVVEITPDPAE